MATLKEKLLAIQTELNAPKNRKNTFGGYSYRSCEDILEAVKPLLKKYKASIKLSDNIEQIGDRYYVRATAMFFHAEKVADKEEAAELIMAEAYAREPEEKKGTDPAQISGASSSYARKYCLNALLLIDDQKDPDTDEYKVETDAKAEKATKKTAKKEENPEEVPFETLISGPQMKTLQMLLKKADITEAKFNSIYGIQTMGELPANDYEDAVKKLETAIKYKKEGEKQDV